MNEFDHDKIGKYLDGEMNAEEQQSFEEQLRQNDALQKEVQLTREVNETLGMKLNPGKSELELRSTLDEMRNEYFSDGISPGQSQAKLVLFRRSSWLAAAAAVIIVILLLTIWSPWQKDLYNQYASIEMPGMAERGSHADILLKQAAGYFNAKKFETAIPIFEAILKDDPQNSFVHFYYAIALLESGKVDKSRYEFLQLYNGSSIFRHDAAFYIALSYLKEKDTAACKQWLDKIPADAGVFNKARELGKKL